MQHSNRAVTPEEMQGIEQRCYEMGIPPATLMEKAGTRVAEFVRSKASRGSRVLVVCGTGNNGGDGFVVARKLGGDYRVRVALIGEGKEVKQGAARDNFNALAMHGIPVMEKATAETAREALKDADVVVCAIFGTGFHGVPPKEASDVIDAINDSKNAMVVAVDVPSGMDAETGEDSHAINADYTITFHAVKTGLLVSKKAGNIVVADIGIPEEADP
jgi:NAD(P)H-hydrate epimerase